MGASSVIKVSYKGKSHEDFRVIEETINYLVLCSNNADGPATARQAAGIPVIGQVVNGETNCVCISVTAEPVEESSVLFNVTAVFCTPRNNQFQVANPLDRPGRVTLGGVARRVKVHQTSDAPAQSICNSAGEPFEGVDLIQYDEMICYWKNHATIDTGLMATYRGAVNSDTITMTLDDASARQFNPGVLMCKNIAMEWRFEIGIGYWQVRIDMEGRTAGWNPQIVDMGFTHLYSGKQVTNRDQWNHPLSRPQLLDGSGNLLAKGGTPVLMGPFKVQPQLPFATILT